MKIEVKFEDKSRLLTTACHKGAGHHMLDFGVVEHLKGVSQNKDRSYEP